MALEPITTDGPTITVSTAEELKDAYELLSHQDGGGTILMEGGEYGSFTIYPYGSVDGDQPVIIKSADADNMARFDMIRLVDATNIRIEDITIDSTGEVRDSWYHDLMVQRCDNIQIVDSIFTHDLDNTLKDSGQIVETFSHIRDSDNIVFTGNLVEGYYHGLQITDTTGFEVMGNEFTNLQGDGIRGGGMQDGQIVGNYLHGFYGTDQSVNHSDLIQIWGANSYQLTQDLTISGNILIAEGNASQSIFIRNEELGEEGDPTGVHYENLTITDNLIYNAHRWGIHIDGVANSTIEGNTVLWNQDAGGEVNGSPYSYMPEIFARNSYNIDIIDNIVGAVTGAGSGEVSGNQIVTYDNPGDTNYVGNHFVDPLAGADVTLEDLFMLPSSPWYGLYGSIIGNSPDDISDGVTAVITASFADDDQYELTYDAGASFGADGAVSEGSGYSFHWTFADGTTATGQTVTKLYDSGGFKAVELDIRLNGETVAEVTRNFAVETKDIFAFDFEDGAVDLSDGTPEVIEKGQLTSSDDGTGYLVGDGLKFEIGRTTDNLYSMDTFGLSLDLTPTGDEKSGVFLELYQTMKGEITASGYLKFSLTTDEGTFSLTSREPVFDDGATHQIGIAFDGTTGQLELFADGESVSSVEAWGTTPAVKYYNLVFGNTFNDSMDAIIDNVVMSVDPAVAGDLPVIDPPTDPEPPVVDPPTDPEEPPVIDPPEEEPPAEDPPAEDPAPEEEPPVVVDNGTDPTDDRGTPQDPVEADNDSGNVLSKLLEKFLELFGLGRGGKKAAAVAEEAAQTSDTTLSDVVPITETLDEDAPVDEAEEDEFLDDLAA